MEHAHQCGCAAQWIISATAPEWQNADGADSFAVRCAVRRAECTAQSAAGTGDRCPAVVHIPARRQKEGYDRGAVYARRTSGTGATHAGAEPVGAVALTYLAKISLKKSCIAFHDRSSA